jgi:hypothetical protein
MSLHRYEDDSPVSHRTTWEEFWYQLKWFLVAAAVVWLIGWGQEHHILPRPSETFDSVEVDFSP